MSMISKTTPFSLELLSFVIQLARLIEECKLWALQQILKSTYLHRFLPKIPTLVGPKRQYIKFV